jgi:hypothetical protein
MVTAQIPFQVTPELAATITAALTRTMTERLVGSTPMLSWEAQGSETEPSIARNGSASLIRTPKRVLGVTAAHVVDGYIAHKQSSSRIAATLGGLRFDLEDRIVACCRTLDIATFAIDAREVSQIGFNVLEGAWPPIAPMEGSFIVFAGWPGCERHIGRDIVTGGAWTGIARAQVSGDIITIDIDHTQGLLSPVPGASPPPPNYEVGGISGGPLMTILPRDGGFDWRLGGVMIQGTAAWDVVRAVRADAIAADGSILDDARA